jgi:hypothetical protein
MPSRSPSVYCAMKASTNTGMDTTIVVDTSTRLSKYEPRRMPARMPAVMPMTISKPMATSASRTVTGSRCVMTSNTGRPLNCVPKSPWSSPPMYLKYCTMSGSLRLYSSRSWATTPGASGRSPPRARIGSPGNA